MFENTCVFTMTNDRYAEACQVMLFSFLHNNQYYDGSIIVFFDDVLLKLSDESKSKIKQASDKIQFVKVNYEEYSDVIEHCKKVVSPSLISTYLKFEMFKNSYDFEKKIWLDSDMVINGDLSEIFTQESLIICEDRVGNGYYNSGFFYFTKDSLVLTNPFELLITVSKEFKYPDFFKKNNTWHGVLGDQDILNEVFSLMFKDIVNFDKNIYNLPQTITDNETLDKAKIIHYLGASKPFEKSGFGKLKSHSYWAKYKTLLNDKIYGNKEH